MLPWANRKLKNRPHHPGTYAVGQTAPRAELSFDGSIDHLMHADVKKMSVHPHQGFLGQLRQATQALIAESGRQGTVPSQRRAKTRWKGLLFSKPAHGGSEV